MIGPGNHVPGQSPAGKEASISLGGDGRGSYLRGMPLASPDPRLPLFNLSLLGQRMESIRRFLSDAIDRHVPIDPDQLQLVSSQIASAARETILNGAALLASSQIVNPSLGTSHFSCIQQLLPSSSNAAGAVDPTPKYPATPRFPETKSLDPLPTQLRDDSDHPVEDGEDCHIVEIDTVELLAEHVHFCDICGKGFKRDANLRMHMRAHGDKFKTLEALSKPDRDVRPSDGGEATTGRKIRFSCPYHGCNRNRAHKKFRPLKSVACVKNHFKRSHCPKTYSCYRCNKKSFSVVADLKSHLKYCGEIRWRCSCGTSFSRKDKLFGHIALFEGHMPAVEVGAEEEAKKKDVILEEDEEEDEGTQGAQQDGKGFDPEFFKGLVEDFDDMERGYWRVD